MLIYTIIVTYNAMQWIDRCLQSLRDSSVASIPIVIDNCSKDATIEHIREKYPEVILFPQNENLGFGQANNLGFRYALEHNADYVLLLNQDASMHPQALENLLTQSDSESLLSPIHLNGNGTMLDYNFKNNTILKGKNTLVDDLLLTQVQPIYPIDMVCAACWLLPKNILQKIGGFDPLFFHYGEDDNYLQRLEYHLVKRYIIPNAFVYHDREKQGNIKAFQSKMIYRRMLIIYANITLSCTQRIIDISRLLKDCYALYFPKKQYMIGTFLSSWIQILSKYKQIKSSRNNNKKLSPHYL